MLVQGMMAAAMLLRHSLELAEEAEMVEAAVAGVLDVGHRTADIAAGAESLSTTAMGDLVVKQIG